MLWEVPTGGFEEIRHSYENLDALDVAPDEPYLAYAGWGNDVVAFDVSRNEIAKRFRSANDRGRAVRFSPDGKQVAAAGDSPGVVVNWLESVGKTRDPLVLLGHHGSTWGLDYAPDGKTIASAGADGSVRIWDVDPDDDADEIKDASDLSTDELLALARARVSRELTDEEAAVFIEGRGVAGSSGG
jgi:WD40 repeat protein